MDFKKTELNVIIRLLANRYEINIFIEDNVIKRTTINLVNISLGEMLNFIKKENNLAIQKSGTIYKVFDDAKTDSSFIPETEFNMLFVNGLLSVNFENEDIRKIYNRISKITGQNIFLDYDVSGHISGFLQNLPVDKALYFLAKINGFYLIQGGLIYKIRENHIESAYQHIPSASFFLNVPNDLVDNKVVNWEIVSILNELNQRLGLSLFLLGDLKGTVIDLAYDLSLDKCLDLLVSINDYTSKKMDKHYLVGNKTNKLLLS